MCAGPLDEVELLVEQAYCEARKFHGDLAVSLEVFRQHIVALIEQAGQPNSEGRKVDAAWLKRVHTNDLFLAIACAQSNETAWKRFTELYHHSVYQTAFFLCRDRLQADEIARSVMGHLFLPDSTGLSRITSYQGLSSLRTWLRAITTHEAINEIRLRNRYTEEFGRLSEVIDEVGSHHAHRTIRTSRYEQLIRAAFKEAVLLLKDKERLILVLRYQEGMKMCDIAVQFGTSQSNLSCRLKQTQKKIRKAVTSILRKQHKLSDAAIKECIEEILENPAYSILDYLSEER